MTPWTDKEIERSQKQALQVERLQQLLDYDALSGSFTWRCDRGVMVKAGDPAGSPTQNGYRRIKVDGHLLLAHRIAWAMETGNWPAGVIDHKNGACDDNRFENLRDVTRAVNMQNQRRAPSSNVSCGLIGVTWLKRQKCWAAQICVGGRKRHLGVFTCPVQAHACYVDAKRALHEGCTL